MAWWNRGGKENPVEKATTAKTPPGKVHKAVYGDKKIVKKKNPKKRDQ